MLLLYTFIAISTFTFCMAPDAPLGPFDILTDEFIDSINRRQSYWTAGRNFPKNTTIGDLQYLGGAAVEEEYEDEPPMKSSLRYYIYHEVIPKLPKFFDVRTKWPYCEKVMNRVRSQGNCSNCWAVSAAAAMSDRTCIASNGSVVFYYSGYDITTCCRKCVASNTKGVFDPCYSGYAAMAWQRWVDRGFVSGGEYNSKEGCKPYPFPKKNLHPENASKCIEQCTNPSYKIPYEKDKLYGKSAYAIHRNIKQIQTEIYLNGPIVTRLLAHTDFVGSYKNGVYVYQTGNFKFAHYVRIIGWGEENGLPYWLGVNTWGEEWGMKGYFKFLRGQNHCDIERYLFAGTFRYSKNNSNISGNTPVTRRLKNCSCQIFCLRFHLLVAFAIFLYTIFV